MPIRFLQYSVFVLWLGSNSLDARPSLVLLGSTTSATLLRRPRRPSFRKEFVSQKPQGPFKGPQPRTQPAPQHRPSASTCTCMSTYIYIYVYIYMYTSVYVCVYASYVCVTYIYTHTNRFKRHGCIESVTKSYGSLLVLAAPTQLRPPEPSPWPQPTAPALKPGAPFKRPKRGRAPQGSKSTPPCLLQVGDAWTSHRRRGASSCSEPWGF